MNIETGYEYYTLLFSLLHFLEQQSQVIIHNQLLFIMFLYKSNYSL